MMVTTPEHIRPPYNPNVQLIVDTAEKANNLTVTATYDGYTSEKNLEVGVRKITTLDLAKGTEIGTTNVYDSGGYFNALAVNPLIGVDTYLVYTKDSKEVKEVTKDQVIYVCSG